MYDLFNDFLKDVRSGLKDEKLVKKYGGSSFYIPQKVPHFREKIVQDFNGGNHIVLADRYNVSIKTVYEILRAKREC